MSRDRATPSNSPPRINPLGFLNPFLSLKKLFESDDTVDLGTTSTTNNSNNNNNTTTAADDFEVIETGVDISSGESPLPTQAVYYDQNFTKRFLSFLGSNSSSNNNTVKTPTTPITPTTETTKDDSSAKNANANAATRQSAASTSGSTSPLPKSGGETNAQETRSSLETPEASTKRLFVDYTPTRRVSAPTVVVTNTETKRKTSEPEPAKPHRPERLYRGLKCSEYIVTRNDSLASIALAHNLSMGDLRTINKLSMLDSDVFPGQVLYVVDGKELKQVLAERRLAEQKARAEALAAAEAAAAAAAAALIEENKRLEEEKAKKQLSPSVLSPSSSIEDLGRVYEEPEEEEPFTPSVRGSTRTPPCLLSDEVRTKIALQLPFNLRKRNWRLLYSTMEHGISFNTFYRRAEAQGPAILVVQSEDGSIFGGFGSEPWAISNKYYGTGECFLFSAVPEVATYRWSYNNEYFMLGKSDFIAFGGGGAFGLWLDADFAFGSSKWCSTFDNKPLCPLGQDFKVYSVELWGFDNQEKKDRLPRTYLKRQENGDWVPVASTELGKSPITEERNAYTDNYSRNDNNNNDEEGTVTLSPKQSDER